jgi:hypothetical protein
LEFELLPKRKVVHFDLIYHFAKFGKFCRQGRMDLVFYKFKAFLPLFAKSRATSPPPSIASELPFYPAASHNTFALLLPQLSQLEDHYRECNPESRRRLHGTPVSVFPHAPPLQWPSQTVVLCP